MPQNPEQGKQPERKSAIYYLASRFKTRKEAAAPYFAVQETIRTNPCDLSAYRFKRQWEEQNDKPWYVLVFGRKQIWRAKQGHDIALRSSSSEYTAVGLK